MNITDASCAIAFEKNIKGPILKFCGIEDAFRVKRFCFALDSSAQQAVAGFRQHGGRIRRSYFIYVCPHEQSTSTLMAAATTATLGKTTIVIAHNRADNKKDKHIEIELKDAAVVTVSTLDASSLKEINFAEFSAKSLLEGFDFSTEIKKITGGIYSTGSMKFNTDSTTYDLIALDYVEISVKYTHIDHKGVAKATSAFNYKAYKKT